LKYIDEVVIAVKDGVRLGLIASLVIFTILAVYSLLLIVIPASFDAVFGDAVMKETAYTIHTNYSAVEFPLAVLGWEQAYFLNPYTENKIPEPGSLDAWARTFSFVKINGSYHIFIRDAPVSWKIKYRLANCGEYAQIFAYIMNKIGYRARVVTAPAEDHMWAEYYNGSQKIVVETSGDFIINSTKDFANGRNWSYIVSLNPSNVSDSVDVSDEYIERANLTVKVYDSENNSDIQITVLSPYLMQADPSRYSVPNAVLSNSTDQDGIARFKLGPKAYIIQARKSFWIASLLLSKNVTVFLGKENELVFDFNKDRGEWKFLNNQ